MNIYYDTTPYFYVIEDVRNGKKYAGSRWRKGCHPSELLREKDGYYTSSKEVNKIIKEHGLLVFRIVKIKECQNKDAVYTYETDYLIEKDAASSNRYYNKHNNDYSMLQYKGNRKVVNDINKYKDHFNLKLVKFGLKGGWWQKTDEDLLYVLERIILAFGEIR